MEHFKYPDGRQINLFVKQSLETSSHIGLDFEKEVINSCEYYKNNDICLIFKRPTPFSLVKKLSSGNFIGKFILKSTTDFVGIYKSKYIDFECKRTLSESFSMNLIKEHQLKHIFDVYSHGGISFLLLEMSYFEEIYLVPAQILKIIYDAKISKLNIDFLRKNCILVKQKINPRIDFIKSIDELISIS